MPLTSAISTQLIQPHQKEFLEKFVAERMKQYPDPNAFDTWLTSNGNKAAFIEEAFRAWRTALLASIVDLNEKIKKDAIQDLSGAIVSVTPEELIKDIGYIGLANSIAQNCVDLIPRAINKAKEEAWIKSQISLRIRGMASLKTTSLENRIQFLNGIITYFKGGREMKPEIMLNDSKLSDLLSTATQEAQFITAEELQTVNDALKASGITITLDKQPKIQKEPTLSRPPVPIQSPPASPPPALSPIPARDEQPQPPEPAPAPPAQEEDDPDVREAMRQSLQPADPDPALTAGLAASLQSQQASVAAPAPPRLRQSEERPMPTPVLPIPPAPVPELTAVADQPTPFQEEYTKIYNRLTGYIEKTSQNPSPGTFYGRSNQVEKLQIARDFKQILSNNAQPLDSKKIIDLLKNIQRFTQGNRRATGNPVFHRSNLLAKILEDTQNLIFNQLNPQEQLKAYIALAEQAQTGTKTGFLGIKSNQAEKLNLAKILSNTLEFPNGSTQEEKIERIKSIIQKNRKATGPEWLHGPGKLEGILKAILKELQPTAPTPKK